MVHTEPTLKGLNKSDLIKLVLQLESEINSDMKEPTSEIRYVVTDMKKVEADVAIFKKCKQEASWSVNWDSGSARPMRSTRGKTV